MQTLFSSQDSRY